MIRLERVEKVYGMGESVVKALDGVSLSLGKGELIAVIGPSGSGKSTLLQVLGALDLPTSGSVFLGGRNIAQLSESELAQLRGKRIGFVFQQFNLIPTLSARENVALPLFFQGANREERMERAEMLLKRVGLGERGEHLPSELSGGEQQRVAIARALVNEPEILLADEPTGNLDSKTGKEIMELFLQLHKEGKTIILVTHNPEIASQALRILQMRDGKIEHEKRRKKNFLMKIRGLGIEDERRKKR